MREVYQGIISRKNSSTGATLRGLLSSCGMYAGWAPQEPTPLSGEYIVLTSPAGTTARTLQPQTANGNSYDEVAIDFSVFSTCGSPRNAWLVVEQIKDLYDDCTLSVSGHTFVSMDRLGPGSPIYDERDKGWQIVVPYEVSVYE